VDIAKSPLDRAGLGTISRQEKQLEAGGRGQPLRHGLSFMNLGLPEVMWVI